MVKMMRGDKRWPPEQTRQQIVEEKEQLKVVAAGPANRPKRANKDYTSFFKQHELNSSFPSYKAPPSTQYFKTENLNTHCNGSNNSNSE